MQVAIITPRRPGRPRKVNVRRTSGGQSKGEVVDLEFFQKQPHRKGWEKTSISALDGRHGTALGRLEVRGLISLEQRRAGDEWGRVVAAYRRALLAPPASPRSGQIADRVSSGVGGDGGRPPDPEEEVKRFFALRDKYNDAFEALGRLDRSFAMGISHAVRKVCVEDRDPTMDEVGNLRIGLNSLVRFVTQS